MSFKQFSIAYITIGAKSNAPFQNLLFSYINFLTLYFFSIYFFSLSTNKVNKQTTKQTKKSKHKIKGNIISKNQILDPNSNVPASMFAIQTLSLVPHTIYRRKKIHQRVTNFIYSTQVVF